MVVGPRVSMILWILLLSSKYLNSITVLSSNNLNSITVLSSKYLQAFSVFRETTQPQRGLETYILIIFFGARHFHPISWPFFQNNIWYWILLPILPILVGQNSGPYTWYWLLIPRHWVRLGNLCHSTIRNLCNLSLWVQPSVIASKWRH